MIGEAFKKIEKTFGNGKMKKIDRESIWQIWKKNLNLKKNFEMKKKWLETTQKIEPLHAKPQNSSKERGSGQYTGKSY